MVLIPSMDASLGRARRRWGGAVVRVAVAIVLASPGVAAASDSAWTTYHHDAARTGVDPSSSVPSPSFSWASAQLDGKVYAEPLVLGSRVYVATENNSVYALDAATGAVVWQANAGTPVPASAISNAGYCGNVSPTVGITGTPVIDPASGEIFAVADTWDGANAQHVLVGYSLDAGAPMLSRVVDVPGAGGGPNPDFNPLGHLQRVALALDGNEVVVGFGGNAGDCGLYHGWLVASREDGSGPLLSYMVPTATEGAIWGGGGGPPVDSAGALYATTGNGSSTTTYDEGNSILKLDAGLNLLDSFAPSSWAADSAGDLDLGSANALLLPDGLLFQAGKNGHGYLVSSAHLGGIGGQLFDGVLGPDAAQGGGSFGGPASQAGVIYVPFEGGLMALTLDDSNLAAPTFSILWQATQDPTGATIDPNGPPILAGGLVWSVATGSGVLYGLDPASGAVRFQTSVSGAVRFTTPAAAGGRLFVGAGNQIVSLNLMGYARPRGATPLRVPLVPAFKPCAPPGNSTHGAPLSYPSCNPPVQFSNFLTVGTPDSNGAQANEIGSVSYAVQLNSAPTPNDVLIGVSTTDVRCRPAEISCGGANDFAGPDYTGQLRATGFLRLTDRRNGTGGADPGTLADTFFPVTVPRATTASTRVGSTCSVATSANAVLPGSVTTGARAVWELGRVKIYDGGRSGVAGASDATLFEDEGIFVP